MNPNGRLTVYACTNGVHYASRLVKCLNTIIDEENKGREGFTMHEPHVQFKVPEVKEFPATFITTRIKEGVRGEDAFLVQWFPAPPQDNHQYSLPKTQVEMDAIVAEITNRERTRLTAPRNKEEFLQSIAALKNAGVKRLSLVTPYAYAQRKDTIEGRDSIDAALFCQQLEGVTHRQHMDAFCLDVHANQIPGYYQQVNISLVSIGVYAMCVDYLKKNHPELLENAVILLPDTGMAKRAGARLSALTGLDRITMDKVRIGPTETRLEAFYKGSGADIAGKDALLFDDILGSGGTAGQATNFVRKELKLKDVSWVMTHPEATRLAELDDMHAQGYCRYVFHADTMPVPRDYCVPFPTAPLVARLMYNIHTDRSIGPYLEATTFLDGKLPLPKID